MDPRLEPQTGKHLNKYVSLILQTGKRALKDVKWNNRGANG